MYSRKTRSLVFGHAIHEDAPRVQQQLEVASWNWVICGHCETMWLCEQCKLELDLHVSSGKLTLGCQTSAFSVIFLSSPDIADSMFGWWRWNWAATCTHPDQVAATWLVIDLVARQWHWLIGCIPLQAAMTGGACMHSPTVKNYHEQPSESPFHACTYYKQAIWQACSMCCWTFTTLFLCLKHERGPCSKQSLSASVELWN